MFCHSIICEGKGRAIDFYCDRAKVLFTSLRADERNLGPCEHDPLIHGGSVQQVLAEISKASSRILYPMAELAPELEKLAVKYV